MFKHKKSKVKTEAISPSDLALMHSLVRDQQKAEITWKGFISYLMAQYGCKDGDTIEADGTIVRVPVDARTDD